jgi:hypothetical protein
MESGPPRAPALRCWSRPLHAGRQRDHHKLVQGWPTQNGVDWEADLRDVKQNALHEEVLMHPKCDREGDATA